MNVISFSLYGKNPIYTIGCIRNAELKKDLFPDWEMWVYYNDTVPKDILKELSSLGVNLINTNADDGYINSAWRFLPIIDSNIEYFISRDCDSRINERDKISVDEWIKSGKPFNIIRDHPIGHYWVMNAGMWGAKSGAINNFKNLFYDYFKDNCYRFCDKMIDQHFLKDIVYPYTLGNCLVHDEYFKYESTAKPIEHDRKTNDFAFIGESIDEYDKPRGDQRTPIKNIYNEVINRNSL